MIYISAGKLLRPTSSSYSKLPADGPSLRFNSDIIPRDIDFGEHRQVFISNSSPSLNHLGNLHAIRGPPYPEILQPRTQRQALPVNMQVPSRSLTTSRNPTSWHMSKQASTFGCLLRFRFYKLCKLTRNVNNLKIRSSIALEISGVSSFGEFV